MFVDLVLLPLGLLTKNRLLIYVIKGTRNNSSHCYLKVLQVMKINLECN